MVRHATWWLAIWCAALLSVHLRAAVPARIVSTSPSITETLFALGLGDRVVGVSAYCRFPPEVLRAPEGRHVSETRRRADRRPAAGPRRRSRAVHGNRPEAHIAPYSVRRRRSRHARQCVLVDSTDRGWGRCPRLVPIRWSRTSSGDWTPCAARPVPRHIRVCCSSSAGTPEGWRISSPLDPARISTT